MTVDRGTGWLAIGIGIVAIATVVILILFFAVGGPFGTINDAGNAGIGILSALLAYRLSKIAGMGVAAAAAIVGAIVTVIGSWLVMTETTGFFLAGLVSSVGFALIGAWLVVLSWSAPVDQLFPGPQGFGRLAGVAMLFGLVGVPGIVMGIDDMDAVPPWLWAYALGWLGTYVLYPVWSLWVGRALLRGKA